jgi:hypothetical protein
MSPRIGLRPLLRAAVFAWAGVVLGAAAVALAPLPAQAHAVLVSSSPSDGDVVASVPTEVVLIFDEAVGSPAFVSVIAPDGSNIAQGGAAVDGATVTQALRLVPEQGAYSMGYRVVSDDGHPVTGTIHFTVDPKNATATLTPAAPVATTAPHTPFWHRESTWVVIALGALALGVVLVFGLGLRSGGDDPDSGGRG